MQPYNLLNISWLLFYPGAWADKRDSLHFKKYYQVVKTKLPGRRVGPGNMAVVISNQI